MIFEEFRRGGSYFPTPGQSSPPQLNFRSWNENSYVCWRRVVLWKHRPTCNNNKYKYCKGKYIFQHQQIGLSKEGWSLKKNLKFLGMEYLHKSNTVRGSTRKGSKLMLDWDKIYGITESNQFSREEFVKLKCFGFIQSRLYQGSWNTEDIKQNFNLTYSPNSWVKKKISKHNIDIFNSSSYASEWLVKMLKVTKKSPA